MSYKYFKNKKVDKGLYCQVCGNKKENKEDQMCKECQKYYYNSKTNHFWWFERR